MKPRETGQSVSSEGNIFVTWFGAGVARETPSSALLGGMADGEPMGLADLPGDQTRDEDQNVADAP